MSNSDFKNIGGLWMSEKKEGRKQYMSGCLREQELNAIQSCAQEGNGQVKIFVFKNEKREGRRDPDYRMSICPQKPKENTAPIKHEEHAQFDDDDVPF